MRNLLLLLLLGAAGCLASGAADPAPAIPEPSRAPERPEPSHFSKHAIIHRSCAPWDGAAVELRLSPLPIECMREADTSLVFSIWKRPEDVSGKTFRLPDSDGRVGVALFCPRGGTCEQVRSGTVRFEPFEPDKPARGQFEVELPDGRRERGSFEATWCTQRVPCG